MATSLPTIQIEKASYAYCDVFVFEQLQFELPPGKWIGLLGPSGVGKTTLLRMIAGLIKAPHPTKIIASNHHSVASQVAYMAQTDLLLPWLTVIDNALLSVKLRSHSKSYQNEKRKQAQHLLQAVGLPHTEHLYPNTLSGGMRQRVALVRTLLMDKPIILMDEPFSALDAITRYQLQALAADILKNKTVLFITHDPLEALRLANIIYVMKGKPAKIKAIATIHSAIPRELNHPDIVTLHASLYKELSLAAQEHS